MKQFCCYCIDLRVGCIIIGIINVLEGLSTFGTAYYHSFTWNIGLCASTTTVAGLLLVFAAVRNNYIATTAPLIFSVISFVSYVFTSIAIFVKTQQLVEAYLHVSSTGSISSNEAISFKLDATEVRKKGDLIGIIFLIAALVQLYYCICVFRFSKQLKNNACIPRIVII